MSLTYMSILLPSLNNPISPFLQSREKNALEFGTFSLLALFVTQLLAFLTNRLHKQIITQSAEVNILTAVPQGCILVVHLINQGIFVL